MKKLYKTCCFCGIRTDKLYKVHMIPQGHVMYEEWRMFCEMCIIKDKFFYIDTSDNVKFKPSGVSPDFLFERERND